MGYVTAVLGALAPQRRGDLVALLPPAAALDIVHINIVVVAPVYPDPASTTSAESTAIVKLSIADPAAFASV